MYVDHMFFFVRINMHTYEWGITGIPILTGTIGSLGTRLDNWYCRPIYFLVSVNRVFIAVGCQRPPAASGLNVPHAQPATSESFSRLPLPNHHISRLVTSLPPVLAPNFERFYKVLF